MGDTTFDQFQSVFGDPLSDLQKGIEKLCNLESSQISALDKLQDFLGQKIEPLSEYQKHVSKKFDDLTQYIKGQKKDRDSAVKQSTTEEKTTKAKSNEKAQEGLSNIKLVSSTAATIPSSLKVLPVRIVDSTQKKSEREEKDESGGLFSMFTGLFSKTKETKSPYDKEELNVLIPAETEVQLQNIIGDTIRPYFNRQDRKSSDLIEITQDIYKFLLAQSKKKEDTPLWKKLLGPLLSIGSTFMKLLTSIPGMLLNIGKQIIPLVAKLLGPLTPLLVGAGLAIAGIMTLLDGFKDTGPYKGLKKLLGKGVLHAGLSMLKKQLNTLTKTVSSVLEGVVKNITNKFKDITEKISGLTKKIFGSSIFKKITSSLQTGISKLFSTLKSLPGRLLSPISKAFKSLFSGSAISKLLPTIGKTGGLFSGLAKGLGVFLKGALKKIPIIGSIISIGYAYSRFKQGDIIGGAIDTLNALTGLLYIVPGGALLALPLSIGLDALNAFLDVKAGGATGKQQSAKIDIFKGIFEWIHKKIKYVPVIGPLAAMGIAVTEGRWLDALGHLAKAVIPPLGVVVDLFNNSSAIAESAVAAGDWLGEITTWAYEKVKNIPVIGSLIKAGEAMVGGRWDEVLGFLGEAIEPLQYIGGLIASGAKSATSTAIDIGGGVADFFSTITDSLLRAVLYMIPDIKIGTFSLRKTVAGLLGISEGGASAASSSSTIRVNEKTGAISSQTSDSNTNENNKDANKAVSPKSKQSTTGETKGPIKNNDAGNKNLNDTLKPRVDNQLPSAAITPKEQKLTPEAQAYMEGDKFDTESLDVALQSQTNFIKAQLEFQKKTADNTKELIEAFRSFKENAGKIVNVNSISSPTTFLTSPVSNTSFRAAMLAR